MPVPGAPLSFFFAADKDGHPYTYIPPTHLFLFMTTQINSDRGNDFSELITIVMQRVQKTCSLLWYKTKTWIDSPRLVPCPLCAAGSVVESLVVALAQRSSVSGMLSEFAVSRALQPAHVGRGVMTSGYIWAGSECFVRELMALLGATAQEIVTMA